MNDESIFLKYLIDEEIYLIDDKNNKKQSDPDSQEVDKHKRTEISKDRTILLLDYSNDREMPGSDKEFLQKILLSVNIDQKEVNNLYREDIKDFSIEDYANCKIIAFLDQIPDNLSALFNSERYVANTYLNHKVLWCDPLDKTKDEKILKRKLWDQLKILFEIPA